MPLRRDFGSRANVHVESLSNLVDLMNLERVSALPCSLSSHTYTATDTIASLEESDSDPMIPQYFGGSKASQSSTNNADVWGLSMRTTSSKCSCNIDWTGCGLRIPCWIYRQACSCPFNAGDVAAGEVTARPTFASVMSQAFHEQLLRVKLLDFIECMRRATE